jgi:hypothetical protein
MPLRPLLVSASAVVALSVVSCRDHADTSSSSPTASVSASLARGPKMPAGLLVPGPGEATGASPATTKERLELGRDKKGNEWAELQSALPNATPDHTKLVRFQPDSRYLSLDAMGLLHDQFTHALPGFDLLLPRFFDAAAVGRLRAELEKFATELSGLSRRAAIERWAASSDLIRGLRDEAAWLEARATLVATLAEVGRFLQGLEARKATMWAIAM